MIRAEVREDRTGRLSATFWLDGNNAYTRAHDLQGEAGPERARANGRATVWRVVAPVVGCGQPY